MRKRPAILVALLTPYARNGNIDLDALRAHVQYLATQGIDGFFACGTTGEGALLEEGEVAQITRAVVRACEPHGLFVSVEVGRPSTAATVRLLLRAFEEGAHAVSAVTPYYYELDDSQLASHYRSLLKAAAGRSLFAYTIPRRAGNDVSPQLARELADQGLSGIKDSNRSLERHLEYRKIAAQHKFEVFMGTDGLALDAFRAGSDGAVSAIANVRPDLFIGLRNTVAQGRLEEASVFQACINALRDSLQYGNVIANLKTEAASMLAAAGVSGYPTMLRAPLGSPTG